MPKTIREASWADIDSLVSLRDALFASAPADAPWSQSKESSWQDAYRLQLEAEFLQPSRDSQLTVVADQGGTVVGTGTGVVDHRLAAPLNLMGNAGWIQGVFVVGSARGQGIAPCIVMHLEQWFQSQGVRSVYLDTTAMAAAMYQRLGYCTTGEPHLVKKL